MGLLTSPPTPRLGDPRRMSSAIVAGVQATSLGGSSPRIIGACHFDPNRVLLPMFAYALPWLRAVLEVTNDAATAHLDLYDPTGMTNGGVPTVVANSEVQSVSVTPEFLELALWNLWGLSGIFQARLWVTGPANAQAICSFASLDLDWS